MQHNLDITKVGLKIQGVDTSSLNFLFFLISVRLSGLKLFPFTIETLSMENTGDPLIFAPSVIDNEKAEFQSPFFVEVTIRSRKQFFGIRTHAKYFLHQGFINNV